MGSGPGQSDLSRRHPLDHPAWPARQSTRARVRRHSCRIDVPIATLADMLCPEGSSHLCVEGPVQKSPKPFKPSIHHLIPATVGVAAILGATLGATDRRAIEAIDSIKVTALGQWREFLDMVDPYSASTVLVPFCLILSSGLWVEYRKRRAARISSN